MIKAYSKFLDKLETVEKIFLGITVAIMVTVMIYQVILRYCFASANSWSEELARYIFIYDVMIAAAIATRKNAHLQVDFLINLFKPKVKCLFTIGATIAGIVFLGFLFKYSLTLCQTAASNISAGLKISMSVFYACMPIGVVLMILTSIEVVLKNIAQIQALNKEEVSGK
ncbi:sialic acid TRAP transporter permease protein SiaT [Anaerotignum neopropionicum]|uniref:Sialic acid TRAP transporter permease protein SiaT n=1 Tax=Anaerotignum neopropionicum TaxID=36847 RepID=A0A136WG82_9FIRM|nr:TRAP transporter small permease [Anaerotignum neopropionicum]KXL53467.1 sialic acid TRAP transporter permease protein SiaT [Anaerotignum neopropionicum]